MRLIDTQQVASGTMILAKTQTAGKGQRGKTWLDCGAENLIVSLVYQPSTHLLRHPFALSAAAGLAVVRTLLEFYSESVFLLKWPNDVYFNDKKTAGILIENNFRGTNFTHSVIGIGLNIAPRLFTDDLCYATSLGNYFTFLPSPIELSERIRHHFFNLITLPIDELMNQYNDVLYRRGEEQQFQTLDEQFEATVIAVNDQGQLLIQQHNGTTLVVNHGTIEWVK